MSTSDPALAAHQHGATQALARLEEITDPIERYQAIQDVLGANGVFVQELAQLTQRTVVAMRDEDGLSYRKIGAALGISHSRAAQLAAGTR